MIKGCWDVQDGTFYEALREVESCTTRKRGVFYFNGDAMSKISPQLKFDVIKPQMNDAEAIARMHFQSWIDTYTDIQPGITEEWVKNYASPRIENEGIESRKQLIKKVEGDPSHNLYYLAKGSSGEILGFIGAQKDSESQELGGLYVDKAYQGKGVAQSLMQKFMEWIDIEEEVFLWVAKYNPRAIRFYEKYGFKLVEGSDKPHKENSPLIIIKMIRKGDKA